MEGPPTQQHPSLFLIPSAENGVVGSSPRIQYLCRQPNLLQINPLLNLASKPIPS